MWDCYECKKMTDHKASDHEKYPDRFRKRGGNTFRGKDFKKHDKTEYNKNQYRGRGLEKNEQKGVKSNKNNKSTKNTKSNYNNYKSANNNRDQKGKESLRRVKGDEEDDGGKSQNEKYITFIADSGATDHVINDSLFLSNFKKCKDKVIKSANKNDSANIVIDGKGDLLLYRDGNENNIFKLTNVISAKDVSENLLSLRKLADAGFNIYLNDRNLEVIEKNTNKIVLEGEYEKPNWVLNFRVKNYLNKKPDEDIEYDVYCCRPIMMKDDEIKEQSQRIIQDKKLLE
ncbi:GSCOCG00012191001-RA-CDS [Cotesia congregata]|nr:GSCOCG00012191001-RA-CDS [Cotesia congregata]